MKYLFALLMILSVCSLSAQEAANAVEDSIPQELREQAYIYSLGKKYNDPLVSRMALYNILASNPGTFTIMDSLALLYFDYQQYASAALVAQDVLKINPEDAFATEIAAISFDNLGVKNRAVSYYEKLYLMNNDLGTLYRQAFLQYDLKRFEEAALNAQTIIDSEKAKEIKLLFPTTDQKQNQEVSMKAAALRLKGMVKQQQGKKDEAKALFNQALEDTPAFDILKQQLKEME